MSLGPPRMRTHRNQGAPASNGSPAMRHDFHLPDDGITSLDRFLAKAAGVHVSTPRPHVAANDNLKKEESDVA
ncbi:hypothetical protein C8K44_11570 [Aminobacter sp. AP02]|nr:hypothetical protein C8K44_11570 [Aminobacter sp. AP02]